MLPEIRKYIPQTFDTYFEPFVGAGAVLFDLRPKKAVINDINEELMNVYHVVRDYVDELIEDLKRHKNEKEYFYALRNLDRKPEYAKLSPVKRASRMIYLNKTCYNGLYRVNRRGEFNVPFGRYKNPQIVNETVLRAVHAYFNSAQIIMKNEDFVSAVATAKGGDFVYFDPPYDPLSETSSFTSYSLDRFTKEDQIRLRDLCADLDERGVRFLLSNSATDFIINLYSEKGFIIEKVEAARYINSDAMKRGKIKEVLVRNYKYV